MLRASLGIEQFPIIYDRIFFPLGGNARWLVRLFGS